MAMASNPAIATIFGTLLFLLCDCCPAGDMVDHTCLAQMRVNAFAQSTIADNVPPMLTDEVDPNDAWVWQTAEALVVSMLETGKQCFTTDVNLFGKPQSLIKQLLIPIVALALGLMLLRGAGVLLILGKILVYFGAQTFMNLYMKVVLSNSVVSKEQGLRGFPAAFAVTALQQIASFLLLFFAFAGLWFTRWQYRPKIISTRFEFITVICFSLAFTINIALNNFSLMLLPISVNLIIRSCAPLTTFAAQQIMARAFNEPVKDSKPVELTCMLVGVVCAAVAVCAKQAAGSHRGGHADTSNLALGVIVCLASLLSASLNMALAGVLGTSMNMNPVDTTMYMSIPSFLFLLLPTFLIKHPSDWPGQALTDWSIMMTVCELNPGVIGLALLSGAFALTYNALQFTIVQTLSATHAAFASNFNKAATIAIAILTGLETIHMNSWGAVMIVGIIGNILAFTVYSLLKADGKKKGAHH